MKALAACHFDLLSLRDDVPDRLPVKTFDRQPFLALNGVQTLFFTRQALLSRRRGCQAGVPRGKRLGIVGRSCRGDLWGHFKFRLDNPLFPRTQTVLGIAEILQVQDRYYIPGLQMQRASPLSRHDPYRVLTRGIVDLEETI